MRLVFYRSQMANMQHAYSHPPNLALHQTSLIDHKSSPKNVCLWKSLSLHLTLQRSCTVQNPESLTSLFPISHPPLREARHRGDRDETHSTPSVPLSLVPYPWLTGCIQPVARPLHLFPILMWFVVIGFGNQSWGFWTLSEKQALLCWKRGMTGLTAELCLFGMSCQTRAPIVSCPTWTMCMPLTSLIWEHNKLNKGADDHGGLSAVCTVYI